MFFKRRPVAWHFNCSPEITTINTAIATTLSPIRHALLPPVNFPLQRLMMHATAKQRPSVACLVIGDEILTGKTHDSNSHSLAKECFRIGMDLQEIRVLSDSIPVLRNAIRSMSLQYDFLFTSGGVGPTHDDLTYEAVAVALDRKLVHHQQTIGRMKEYFTAKGVPLTDARKRMALFPEGSEALFVGDTGRRQDTGHGDTAAAGNGSSTMSPFIWVPVVRCENIYILPGVPRLFQPLIKGLFDKVLAKLDSIRPLYRRLIGTQLAEGDLADRLRQIQQQFSQFHVRIGSYPRWPSTSQPTKSTVDDASDIRVLITVEGPDEKHVGQCVAAITVEKEFFEIKE